LYCVYLQIFDILPLYSTLHPHESQKIQFTFYGHANISSQAVARCSVHGGPDYDIELLGQASLVQYFFDRQVVDYGKQVDCGHLFILVSLHNRRRESAFFTFPTTSLLIPAAQAILEGVMRIEVSFRHRYLLLIWPIYL